MYELWIAVGGTVAHEIYFSDLPWPIGKILHWKKIYDVKKLLGVTKQNCEEREAEVIRLHPQHPPSPPKPAHPCMPILLLTLFSFLILFGRATIMMTG